MSYAVDVRAAPSGFLEHPITTLGKLRLAFRRFLAYRQTVNELNGLSDRELDDLGIGRGEIPFVAAENADLITRS